MVAIAERPMMIESPAVTARDVHWESYEEVVAWLARCDGPDAEPQVFRNDAGHWVRWWAIDDPDTKRINPETGALENRTYHVQRRVALHIDTVDTPPENRGWDFLLADPLGGTLFYGRPYVWMHGGLKPETDPGLFYARQREELGPKSGPIRDIWKPSSAQQQAAFIEQQQKLRQTTGLTQVIQGTVEVQQPAGAGGKVKSGGV